MIKFIEFSLRNRLLVVSLAVLMLAGGYAVYRNLPIEAFPDVSPVLVQVFTETHGLAPEEVEKYVTFPVEVAMMGLPNLKLIRSVSNFGLSVVNIYFEDGTDIYFARQVVNERLQEAREQIPEGFGEPQMGPISSSMGLILFYYLKDESGKYSLEELRTIQDWIIKYNLQNIPGVTEVLSIGGYEKQFQVIVNPFALLRYDLTINEVIEKIRANNLNVGAQFLVKNREEYIVRSVGLVKGTEDIENIILKSVDGVPVFLKDVAEVKIGGAIRRGIQTMNGGKEVVAGMVIKLYGENSSTVIERIEKRLEEINRMLPEGVKIAPYYEQKSLIESCVSTVTTALGQGIILVIFVLMLFLGSFRPGLVVALSIPFSILFAAIWMRYFGITANLMSLGGLAIAIGMMVDGTIVMVENVDRMLRSAEPGDSKLRIVMQACSEVARPITFAIIIIIVVFLPLFTLKGVEGKMFRPLAYTVALAMFGSLVFAVFIAPPLASLFVKVKTASNNTAPKNQGTGWLLRKYQPLVEFFVTHWRSSIGFAIALTIIGIIVFGRLGSEFTPTLQEGTIVVRLTMAPSISLEEGSKEIVKIVEKRLLKIPEVSGVITRIGRGEVGAHTDPVNNAEMYILLKPPHTWERAKSQEDIERIIRRELGEVPGVLINLTQPIEMTVDELLEGVRAQLAIKIFGDDLHVLEKKAEEIAAVIREIPGAADVQRDQVSGTPQVVILPDREKIARYGINIQDVQGTIEAVVGGVEASYVFEGVRRFAVYVRFAPEFRNTSEDIGNILIRSSSGVMVPLSQIAEIKEVTGPRQITRENGQRFITVQCNVVDRDIGSFVNEAQRAIREKVELPSGYFVTWGGQFKLQQEANRRLAVVVPVTLLIVFILLYSSFNSMKNSLLILLNIPLALVGGVVALWLSGQNLSVPASVGFIALFGIALENAMVLVTYINQLVREGLPLKDACIKGACLRLRPVLMTALTTALGLIPLLFSHGTGSEIQRPLATVVIGGLLTSTALTLLVIPALYRWFSIKPEIEAILD